MYGNFYLCRPACDKPRDKPQHLMYGNPYQLCPVNGNILDKPQHLMYGNVPLQHGSLFQNPG